MGSIRCSWVAGRARRDCNINSRADLLAWLKISFRDPERAWRSHQRANSVSVGVHAQNSHGLEEMLAPLKGDGQLECLFHSLFSPAAVPLSSTLSSPIAFQRWDSGKAISKDERSYLYVPFTWAPVIGHRKPIIDHQLCCEHHQLWVNHFQQVGNERLVKVCGMCSSEFAIIGTSGEANCNFHLIIGCWSIWYQ